MSDIDYEDPYNAYAYSHHFQDDEPERFEDDRDLDDGIYGTPEED